MTNYYHHQLNRKRSGDNNWYQPQTREMPECCCLQKKQEDSLHEVRHWAVDPALRDSYSLHCKVTKKLFTERQCKKNRTNVCRYVVRTSKHLSNNTSCSAWRLNMEAICFHSSGYTWCPWLETCLLHAEQKVSTKQFLLPMPLWEADHMFYVRPC